MSQDLDWEHDLPDIQQDIDFIARQNGNPVAGAGTRKATITNRRTPASPPRTTAI